MKTWAGIASAVVLSACATAETPARGAVANGSAGEATYYCWKNRLATSGDSLVCNWEKSFADACRSTYDMPMPASAVASGPSNAGRCENGQWLVKVTTR
jgi:hypothetical protein